MPRGNSKNPFCQFTGEIRAPKVKAGDWLLLEATPSLQGYCDGQMAEVVSCKSYYEISTIVEGRARRDFDWNRRDRWKVVDPPKHIPKNWTVHQQTTKVDPPWFKRPQATHPDVINKDGYEGWVEIDGNSDVANALDDATSQLTTHGTIDKWDSQEVLDYLKLIGKGKLNKVIELAQLMDSAYATSRVYPGFIDEFYSDGFYLAMPKGKDHLKGLEEVVERFEGLGFTLDFE